MTTRRQKMPKLKRRKDVRAARRRGASAADLQKQLDQRTRELAEAQKHLAEALEQQTAASEVLQIISSSPRRGACAASAMPFSTATRSTASRSIAILQHTRINPV
jgi:hypothetical protein